MIDHSLFVNDGRVILLRPVNYVEAIKQQNASLPILCRAIQVPERERVCVGGALCSDQMFLWRSGFLLVEVEIMRDFEEDPW